MKGAQCPETETLLGQKPPVQETKKAIAEDNIKMSVFPNPARNEINIKITGTREKYLLRIKNLMGQSIYEQQFSEKQMKIDSSQFPKGFFLVEVSTIEDTACRTEKVVIQ